MLGRIVSRIMLILLSTSIVASAFGVQHLNLESETVVRGPMFTSGWQNTETTLQRDWDAGSEVRDGLVMHGKLDSHGLDDLRCLAEDDDKSIKLIVGVNVPETQVQQLKEIISKENGKVSGTISMGENVQAFIVEVPISHTYTFTERLKSNGLVKYVEPNFKVEAFYTPNDPYWSSQWGPRKIEVDFAWNTTIGSSEVLVAVVDSGIDYTHADLATNYVPLGYDWVNNDTDPIDDRGHGTHCAGIIAASLNNSIGIAGLAQVRIMAEKVLTREGWGYDFWVAQGIIHATDQGAKIISMSLGSPEYSQLVHDAVKYAYDHGVLLVAAAGNSRDDWKNYPAAHEEVIAVSATNSSDQIARFSSFGNWIGLSAPGVNIFSTILSNSYASRNGTSMACPHVTGAAALAWSVFPDYTHDQIRFLLQQTSDDLGDVGFDKYYGWGRINARKAVAGLPEHDMGITRLEHPDRIDPGQLGMFNATVSNCGRNNETGISVEFLVNETLADVEGVDFLQAATSTIITFSLNTTLVGNYNITCYVVPVSGDNRTENNSMSCNVFVRFPTILRVPHDYPTIKEAINNALLDDTVLVSGGYYTEGRIDIYKSRITLATDGLVTLDGLDGSDVLNIKADNVVINGFVIRNAQLYGIKLRGFNNTLMKNTISDSYCGIYLDRSSNSSITLNNAKSNLLGILLEASSNNSLVGNNATANTSGILVNYSPNNVLRDNRMADNQNNFGVQIDFAFSEFINDIDTSNTVNGKPIYYWINKQDLTVPFDAGYVGLVNCTNIRVRNLDLRNNIHGVLLACTTNTTIAKNNIENNHAATYLTGSSNNSITGNKISSRWSGIWIESSSSYNRVFGNNIIENSRGIELWGFANNNMICGNNITANEDGILLCQSSNSSIFGNNLTANSCGIDLLSLPSNNNVISENNITANGYGIFCYYFQSNSSIVGNNIIANDYGIWLEESSNGTNIIGNNIVDSGIYIYVSFDNKFYHNTFRNVAVESIDSTNIWDDGYPSGGNYWSDYTGVDLYSGPYQNENGGDGIGDIPYIIDADNIDNYPLIDPWSPTATTLKANITKGGQTYDIQVISNATVLDFNGNTGYIKIKVSGESGASGFVKVIQPVGLNTTEIKVFLNNTRLNFPSHDPPRSISTDGTHYLVYFEFALSTHHITVLLEKVGDLGGGLPPEFFNFDNIVDAKDLALFIQCYRGLAPQEAMYLADLGGGIPPQFFACDGKVDGKDLALFIQCYKGQGPDT